MRAWLLPDFQGIRSLQFTAAKDPVAGAGEAVLRVRFAALNPADYYLAAGQYPAKPPLPHILGRDGIGVVVAVGEGVTQFKAGDLAVVLRSEIGVSRAGMFAELVSVPVQSLTALPPGWTAEQAAAAPLVYLTAYQALTQWGDLPPSVVLITGASGGVGVATLQLAIAMGHTVIGLSRNAEKREQLRQMGASLVYDPQDGEWSKRLKKDLPDRRVDLAVDNVGGPLFNDVLSTLGQNGKMSVIGRLAGAVPEFNTASLFFRRIKIGGVAVGTYTPVESQNAWRKIIEIMQLANVRPLIDSIFDFEKLPDAFAKLQRGPMGKVLLKVSE